MDTLFGLLSGVHRDHLLDIVPKMVSQWILLATDTEFTEVEANALGRPTHGVKFMKLVKDELLNKSNKCLLVSTEDKE